MLNVNTQNDWIVLSEGSDLSQYTGEDCVFTFLLFPFLSNFLNVFGEHIHQVINDVGCENLYWVLLGVLLGIVKNLNIENQQATISELKMKTYSFLRFYGTSDKTDFMAFITSSFDTGPTVMYETGTFWLLRYSSKAYREPNVEAATPTPKF